MSDNTFSGKVGISLGTLLLGAVLLRGCVVDGIENKLDKINQTLSNPSRQELTLERRNVIGGEAPEEFYIINGQRVYVSIDGKPLY